MAFTRHSTSLFSIYDSPGTSSAHRSSAPVLPTTRRRRCRFTPDDPTVTPVAPAREPKPITIRSPPTLGKRRQSEVSQITNEPMPASRARKKEEPDATGASQYFARRSSSMDDEEVHRDVDAPHVDLLGVGDDLHGAIEEDDMIGPRLPTPPAHDPALSGIQSSNYRDPRLPGLIDEFVRGQLDRPSTPPLQDSARTERTRAEDTLAFDDQGIIARMQERDLQELLDIEEADFDNEDEEELMYEYGPEMFLADGDGEVDMEMLDDDDDEDANEEDEYFEDDELDEDDMYDDDEDDEDEEGIYPDRRSGDTELGGVEMIQPRRIFKGAKNVETVKDCMLHFPFLCRSLVPTLPQRQLSWYSRRKDLLWKR